MIQTAECDNYDERIITTLKYSRKTVKPVIVNGMPAHLTEFPYLVSLKEAVRRITPKEIVWMNLCGGSIIAKLKVLTAAHCFEGNNFYYAKRPSLLRLVAGNLTNDVIHSGETETTVDAQWRRLKKIVIHAEFSFPSNDIALVFIDQPWQYSLTVKPINIAEKGTDYYQCTTAGYGRIGHSLKATISPILLKAHISTIPRSRCSLLWEMDMSSFVCTESALTDVSRGDSGGPLACQGTDDPNEVDDMGVLAGVVSGKNFDKTTLFTRVSAFHDWVTTDGAEKLCVSLHPFVIILFILIYLLFYLSFRRYFEFDVVTSFCHVPLAQALFFRQVPRCFLLILIT